MRSSAGDKAPGLAYITPFLEAWRAGAASDHIHLGYWEAPPRGPVTPRAWAAAQARLSARVVAMAGLDDGQRIADVACGIGGTLRQIAATVRPDLLIGVNIDPRQLAHCPGRAEGVERLCADASALPLAPASLDRILCVEAAFHFAGRDRFLARAAAALRPGGRLVIADILIDPGSVPESLRGAVETALRRDFGPWPEPWITRDTLARRIAAAGLEIGELEDATRATLPSYAVIAPGPPPGAALAGEPATRVMHFLHARGALRYLLVAADRRM